MRKVPAILAFVVLCFQVALPWTARHFVTQDGSAHLYESVVARDLLFNPRSPYHAAYTFQHNLVPNSTSTVVLSFFASVAGVAHAEQLMSSFLMIFGFLAFVYASNSFQLGPPRWSPLANALLQTYFLTRGYFNFELGMALGLLVLGYGIRRIGGITLMQAIALACGWMTLFFTHLVPAMLGIMTFLIMAAWVYVPHVPQWAREPKGRRAALKTLSLLVASTVPTLLLTLEYTRGLQNNYPANALAAFRNFPVYLFMVSSGVAGHQPYMFPAMVCLALAALLTMKAADWRSARGGLVVAICITFGLYLFVPDVGFGGGGDIKVRLAYAVFLLTAVLATSLPLSRPIWFGFSIGFAIAAVACLVTVMKLNVKASAYADAYESVMDQIPQGSTVVRLYYPAPVSSARFGIPNDIFFLPLLHVDSDSAAKRHAIELSDYSAPTRMFPIVFQPPIPLSTQWTLWTFDSAVGDGSARLKSLWRDLPVTIDYYVVLGEDSIPDLPDVKKDLESAGKHLIKSVGEPPFARLYH